jgi:hypothetical protein
MDAQHMSTPLYKVLNKEEQRHAEAMDADAIQCPQCANGWLQYRINIDQYLCPLCQYNGGWVKK